ncbi:kinase-like domain-containing protein [Xylaria digitata]|nr:kinase-like domain-containing protein [Xylaria digitata]
MENRANRGPTDWYEEWRAWMWWFRRYREWASASPPDNTEMAAYRAHWINLWPLQGPRSLWLDDVPAVRAPFLQGAGGRAFPGFDGPTPPGADRSYRDAKEGFQRTRGYFARSPRWEYVNTLGYGGAGVAIRYRFHHGYGRPPFNLVVKAAKRNWVHRAIRREIMMTRKLERAAHSIQMIPRDRVGLEEYKPYEYEPPISDDSSDDGNDDSSGDESRDDGPGGEKRTRREIDAADPQRARDKRNLLQAPDNAKPWVHPDYEIHRKDFVLTEFCENGNLEQLLYRYPPRKFHPRRRNDPPPDMGGQPGVSINYAGKMVGTDLFEEVPPARRRWAIKRNVHFDITPKNIFIAGHDVHAKDNEHKLVPRLKLANFGRAHEIKPRKRNEYYVNRRNLTPFPYSSPEQFGIDWEYIQKPDGSIVDQDGSEISEQKVAGNYGSATNVWGIGLTMWQIMTLREAPVPPILQVRSGITANLPQNYCLSLLTQDQFKVYDEDLRLTIARCMAHDPNERPSLRTLLQGAQLGINKRFPAETDEFIKSWVQDLIYDADV